LDIKDLITRCINTGEIEKLETARALQFLFVNPNDAQMLKFIKDRIERQETIQLLTQDPFIQSNPIYLEERNNSLKLGIVEHSKIIYSIQLNRFLTHCLICGRTGGGKSNSSLLLIIQFLELGFSGLVIFDNKSDYKVLVAYYPNFLYLTMDSFRDNILKPPPGIAHKVWLTTIFELLSNYFDIRVAVRNMLLECALWLFEVRDFVNTGDCPTLEDLFRVVKKQKFSSLLSREARYQETAINRLKGILNVYGKTICSNQEPNWNKLLNLNFSINTEGIPTDYRCFFIACITAKIMLYRIANSSRDGILKNLMLIDEAGLVFKESSSNLFLSDMVRLVREYGIGMIFLTQTLTDLDHTILANTAIKILVGGLGSGTDYQIFSRSVGIC